jgi:cytochrome P450
MPSLRALAASLGLLLLAWGALRSVKLIANYWTARKFGLPIVVVPVSWEDTWWVVVWRKFAWIERIPVFGYWLPFSRHAWTQQSRYRPHEKYGDAFVVVSPNKVEVMVNEPVAGVELQAHYKSWVKPPPIYVLFEMFGPGVISVNGEDWQRHRKIVNPAFREQNNRLVWDEARKQAAQMLEVVAARPDGTTVTLLDVRNDCVLIAMHVLSAAGFGQAHDFDGGFRDVPPGHTRSLADTLMYLLSNLLWVLLCTRVSVVGYLRPGLYREVMEMCDEFRRYMKEIVAYHRATTQAGGGGHNTADIVSALVEADEAAKREETKAGLGLGAKPMHLTDDELMGNLFVFNLAGFETTANAMTYTIPFLAAHRDVQDWAGEEVDAIFGGRDTLDYEEAFPQLVRVLAVMVSPAFSCPFAFSKRPCLWSPGSPEGEFETQSIDQSILPCSTRLSGSGVPSPTPRAGRPASPRFFASKTEKWSSPGARTSRPTSTVSTATRGGGGPTP